MLRTYEMAGRRHRARQMRSRMMGWMARRELRALRSWLRRRERLWAQDVARQQLTRLSDHMLRDIGLRRFEIDGMFRRA
jgi:uncharacterized protein YjiS (DUF1127 family)